MNSKPLVAFIGCGNVGETLALAFLRAGVPVGAVIIPEHSPVDRVHPALRRYVTSKLIVPAGCDFAIVAVPDNRLQGVADTLLVPEKCVVVHTSGGSDADILKACSGRFGVLYPLQTFTRGEDINMAEIPLFTEASDYYTLEKIDRLASLISDRAYHADSRKRRRLHLSAVFVCNFVNHMVHAGYDLAMKEGIGRELFGPLLDETFRKIVFKGPERSQTGPAVRGDNKTVVRHMEELKDNPILHELYRVVTESIIYYQKDLKDD